MTVLHFFLIIGWKFRGKWHIRDLIVLFKVVPFPMVTWQQFSKLQNQTDRQRDRQTDRQTDSFDWYT